MAHPGPTPSHRAPFERTWVLREQRDSIEALQADVGRALHEFGYGEACTFAVRLALEEALVNGFRHGNKGDASKSVTVRCRVDAGLTLLVASHAPALLAAADAIVHLDGGRNQPDFRAGITAENERKPEAVGARGLVA